MAIGQGTGNGINSLKEEQVKWFKMYTVNQLGFNLSSVYKGSSFKNKFLQAKTQLLLLVSNQKNAMKIIIIYHYCFQ